MQNCLYCTAPVLKMFSTLTHVSSPHPDLFYILCALQYSNYFGICSHLIFFYLLSKGTHNCSYFRHLNAILSMYNTSVYPWSRFLHVKFASCSNRVTKSYSVSILVRAKPDILTLGKILFNSLKNTYFNTSIECNFQS